MKNNNFPPHFRVKRGMHGLGVFLEKDVKKGEILFKMKGEILESPTRTSVQIGAHQHIEDKLAGFMNHSCEPNTKVAKRARAFVSLRNIHKGEEITFNYNANEDKLAAPFRCTCCGRKMFGRKITPAKRVIHRRTSRGVYHYPAVAKSRGHNIGRRHSVN